MIVTSLKETRKHRKNAGIESVQGDITSLRGNHGRALRLINELIRDGCREPMATGWTGKVGY